MTQAIQQYDAIAIFRHVNPDCDAMGAQFGLKCWLEENFPDKKVYALGQETTTQRRFPALDSITDARMAECLAIILDTANADRVDGNQFRLAPYLIRIDHHPDHEPDFGDLRLIDPVSAATSQILAFYFQEQEASGRILSRKAAEYLYSGLLTDTLCFRTTNTTGDTLRAGAYLADKGLDISRLNRVLFDQSLNDFRFANHLRREVWSPDNRVAYVILNQDELREWNITGPDARKFIDEIGHVKEFQAWAVFTENGKHTFDGSLRSRRVAVNDLAEEYHGGGHKNAAGVKELTADQIKELMTEIDQRVQADISTSSDTD